MRRDALFLVIAVAVVGLYVLLASQRNAVGFPLDDAWIHQTYARNLAENGEWAFIPGQTSAASTAPLYSALLAIGHLLGLALFAWTFVLGVLALTLAASIGARIAEILFPTIPYVGLATGLVMLLTWHLVWAAASGMETMQFMALSLVVIWLALRELGENHSAVRGLLLGIAGGLLTLTRPEGILLVGLVGLFMLIGDPRRYLIWAVGVGIGWLIVTGPYLAWNYDVTGELLPSTADAKIAEFAPLRETFILRRYFNMTLPVLVGAQFLALPGIVIGIWLTTRRAQENRHLWLLPLVWAFLHLTVFVVRLPANYQHGRYVMPILPVLLLYAAGGMIHLVQTNRYSMLGRVSTRTLALSAAAAFPTFVWLGGGAYANDVRIINTEMVETAKWVNGNVPQDELFAVHDIGALGYYAPRDILDLAGLVSLEVVPIIRDHEALMALICERDARWLMVFPDQRPVPADDARLEVRYESPYNFAAEAHGGEGEAWKMRVYAVNCEKS